MCRSIGASAGLANGARYGHSGEMGETVLILLWLALWALGLYVAWRLALWMLKTVIATAGKAWRGEK